jgi:hypothetical protein
MEPGIIVPLARRGWRIQIPGACIKIHPFGAFHQGHLVMGSTLVGANYAHGFDSLKERLAGLAIQVK